MAMLSGCGFRLQGTGPALESVSNVYVEANDRYTFFYRELSDQLSQRGATMASSADDADSVIYVIEDSRGERVSAVSIRNTPLEYEVFYTVKYSVRMAGNEVIEPTRIITKNRYEFDETKVLGKAEERDMLLKAQAADIARQVLVQLSAI